MILRPALVRQFQGSVDFVVLVEMEDEERELTLKKSEETLLLS
jgi:hypothetical protein